MSSRQGNTQAGSFSRTQRFRIAVVTVLGFGLWWLGSILLHALFFGALYVASPKVSSPVAANDDFQMTISADHVETVVADIREQQREEFTKKVSELSGVKEQLDALNAKKVEQYNALMQDEAKQAPKLAQEALADARAAQASALQSQVAAQAAIARMDKDTAVMPHDQAPAESESVAATTQTVESAQAAVGQAQKKVAAAQVKLSQQINMFGDATADARQAAQTAANAQETAEQQQDKATASRVAVARAQRQVEQRTGEIQRATVVDDEAKQRVSGIEKRLAELQPPPPPPATPPVAAESAAPGDLASQPASTPAPTPAPTPSKKTQQEIDRLTKALPLATNNAQKTSVRLTDLNQKLAAGQAEAAEEFQKLKASEDQAHEKQRTALEAQIKAGQQIAEALAKPNLVPEDARPGSTAAPAAASDANLAQLFAQAQQLETAVADSYKNVRAAELAAIRKIPLSEALKLTEVAKPVRDAIDTSVLTKNIRDVAGVRAQEKTIQTASAQMNSMVALARRMKELAQPEQQAAISVNAMKATAAQSDRMEQLAAEDEGTKAKDLTAAMQGAAPAAADAHHQGDEGQAAAMARATAAVAAAAAKFALQPLDLGAATEYLQAVEALNALAALAAHGAAGEPAAAAMAGLVPGTQFINSQKFKPVPGRTISRAMVPTAPDREATWMFLDSWYLIGPWPNPQRKNLNTKFPPESVVDLDASYTGGRRDEVPLPVRWQFYQGSATRKATYGGEVTGMIVPPRLSEFEIYYGYTELWLDEAADLWVAIGSDDQSKIWLNDQMIWKSADYYKSWTANEGLRKVHFIKGTNRLLYRLENGQNSGGFSFMVCLNANAVPPPEAKPAGQR